MEMLIKHLAGGAMHHPKQLGYIIILNLYIAPFVTLLDLAMRHRQCSMMYKVVAL